MTRLLTTGYETGDVAEAGVSAIGTNAAMTAVSSTPTPRAGAYCLKFAVTSGSSFNVTTKTFNFAASKTEVWIRWAIFIHPGTSGAENAIAQLLDSGGNQQSSITWDGTSTLLRLRVGATANAGTIIGTSSAGLATDSWHVLEWRWKVITATTGNAELWLDGTQVITFSGDVANSATLNALTLILGVASAQTNAAGAYQAIDDVAVNDISGSFNNARIGDGYVVLLKPTGAGTTTQLTRGGTDTGANYSQVNELPPVMTQYVLSATVGQRDLYALDDLPAGIASINAVEAVLLAQKSDAGAGSLAPTIKSSSTTTESTAQALGTSAAYIRQVYETDPATSAAWTTSAVNALEAGATVR